VFGRKSAQIAWNEACAEADHLDPGWRWDDLIARRPNPPPQNDARQAITAAISRLPERWPNWESVLARLGRVPDLPDPLSEEFDLEFGQRAAIVADQERGIEADLEANRNQTLTEESRTALAAVLADAHDAYVELQRAMSLEVGCPRDGPRPVVLNLPTDLALRSRSLAKLLQWHAHLSADTSQADAALRDGVALLTLARAAAEPPMLITILIAFAFRNIATASITRTIALGEAGSGALEVTQAAVERALAEPLLLDSLRGERALTQDLVDAVRDRRITRWQLAEHETMGEFLFDQWRRRWNTFRRAYFQPFRVPEAGGVVRYYSALVELLKESPDAAIARPDRLREIQLETSKNVLDSQQNALAMFLADRQQRAKLSCLACALAAERFRRAQGQWPGSLSNLVPEFLSSVPADPYDLRPLRFRRTTDGLIIYTLGPDEHDGGGLVDVPPLERPCDIGVRLWDPVARRISS
jgi:hypothetical protein